MLIESFNIEFYTVTDSDCLFAGGIPAPSDVGAPPSDAEVTPSGLASKVLKAGNGRAAGNGASVRLTQLRHYTYNRSTIFSRHFFFTLQKGRKVKNLLFVPSGDSRIPHRGPRVTRIAPWLSGRARAHSPSTPSPWTTPAGRPMATCSTPLFPGRAVQAVQADPRLKAPSFQTLILKKHNSAFNFNPVFPSLRHYI